LVGFGVSEWVVAVARRDIKIGKTMGQMYMTTDGVLIFRWGWWTGVAACMLVTCGMYRTKMMV
jgi:hypothetical protein